jgi:hypothetical protein
MRLEIACDESGAEGEKLVGGVTDVFAHASVALDPVAAGACVRELREWIRSPATEYKANHLLREKHRDALLWLLGPSGPIRGHAVVLLVDKTLFLVRRMVELLAVDTPGAAELLHRRGPREVGAERWAAFLASFNDLARPRNRNGGGADFFADLDYLLRLDLADEVRAALESISTGRDRIEAYRARDPRELPLLDPIGPAIVEAVTYWDGPVSIVHDRQLALTEYRIARLVELCGGRLAGLRLVAARLDARVQVADFLAGVARRIVSDELAGRGDGELLDLLAPFRL